jgi:hypothetical protein
MEVSLLRAFDSQQFVATQSRVHNVIAAFSSWCRERGSDTVPGGVQNQRSNCTVMQCCSSAAQLQGQRVLLLLLTRKGRGLAAAS